MKKFLILILFLVFMDLSFQRCANPGRPTGGPKDTIPPTLIFQEPISGTVKFDGNTIQLEFDEFINADKLKQQLVITPRSDINYKSLVKRNQLIIKLEDDLQDSTTYNLNFADGVTDITEKNPAVNLSIAFSTGTYIDSMSIAGTVEELMDQTPGSGYLVGLYPLTDTLDYFKENPLYFATASDSGEFVMNYLKKGDYKILAFNDDNRNLLLDPETESHGFLEDTIRLDSNLYLRPIRCVLQNVKPIKLINGRSIGPYVEVKYNKNINSYQLKPEFFNHNTVGDNNDIIRIYKHESVAFKDSLESYIIASDSLGNDTNDTIKFVFLESNRKPADFSYASNKSELPLEETIDFKLNFNKPILSSDLSGILIKADSLASIHPNLDTIWNFNYTQVDLTASYEIATLDSLTISAIPDSIKLDTLGNLIEDIQRRIPLSFYIPKGSFISIEQDSSSSNNIAIRKKSIPEGGELDMTIDTDQSKFFLQLLSQGKVAYQSENSKKVIFKNVVPGKYIIRILIDNNQDGKWSFGNLLSNSEPEDIILLGETEVRENWVLTPTITF